MAVETVELGTTYLVDLVGSTRLATSVGPVRWDEMREQFSVLCGGDRRVRREFKTTGDRLIVAFATASAAVGCAVLTAAASSGAIGGRSSGCVCGSGWDP